MAATAITRAQVREALIHSSCSVPDFTTREKATLVWSKVYISLGGNKLHFVELNFFQRCIRYLVGCICSGDTIFTDKVTLEKVKEYIHGIKAAPTYLDPIAMNLFPKAKTRSDFSCLCYILEDHKTVYASIDDVEYEDFNNLSRDVKDKLSSGNLKEGFSEEFLSAALLLARKNLKQNPDDKMWLSIQTLLWNTRDLNQTNINNALFREVMGLPKIEDLPSQKIAVPEEIARLFSIEITSAQAIRGGINTNSTLESFLKALAILEKLTRDLNAISEVFRPVPIKVGGKQMVAELRRKLIGNKAHPALVDAYLNDEQQITGRLYYHADLSDRIVQDYRVLDQDVQHTIKVFRAWVMVRLNSSYRVTLLSFQTDSFSASCDNYQVPIEKSWRQRIADELSRNEDYRILVESRIKEDADFNGYTFEKYCQRIRKPISPVGLPELNVFSQITGHPVLVVQLVDAQFKWISGINLNFNEEPFIFNSDGGVWSPVEKRF